MYETLYQMCQNTERVMKMFSEELRMLDRNTVRYMIEEQQREIDKQKEQINQQAEQINQQAERINQQTEQINQQAEQIATLQKELEEQKANDNKK